MMRYATRIAAGLSAYAVAFATIRYGPGEWIYDFYSAHFCIGDQLFCSDGGWGIAYGVIAALSINWLLLKLLHQRRAFWMAAVVSLMVDAGIAGQTWWQYRDPSLSNTAAWIITAALVVVIQSAATWAFGSDVQLEPRG